MRLCRRTVLAQTTIARSWRPIFERRDAPWRTYVIGETSIGRLSVAVRDARYKSIIERDNTRLYDLQNDPLETQDLADDAHCKDIVACHRAHFREYISQIEMYPEPEIDLDSLSNVYREYIDWYLSVLNEA